MLRTLLGLAFKLSLYFVAISIGWVALLKVVPVWYTPHMLVRKWEAGREDKETRLYKDWTPLSEISTEMALAVIASEDQMFPSHWGFDFEQLSKVMNEKRKRVRGASTISQQVAKNVFLWHGRSYVRKGFEAYFTLLIEVIWGKKRILEVYLNVAETGPMTFGVEAASQRFYKKPAINLTRKEAARIAAVLPNPIRYSIANPSSYVQKRTSQITRQMRALGGTDYLQSL